MIVIMSTVGVIIVLKEVIAEYVGRGVVWIGREVESEETRKLPWIRDVDVWGGKSQPEQIQNEKIVHIIK